jgi:hypothetical protein
VSADPIVIFASRTTVAGAQVGGTFTEDIDRNADILISGAGVDVVTRCRDVECNGATWLREHHRNSQRNSTAGSIGACGVSLVLACRGLSSARSMDPS